MSNPNKINTWPDDPVSAARQFTALQDAAAKARKDRLSVPVYNAVGALVSLIASVQVELQAAKSAADIGACLTTYQTGLNAILTTQLPTIQAAFAAAAAVMLPGEAAPNG